ncbi:MAG: Crp/Fnr family transcriptional regulator [Pseudomonadota bacterium]
MRHITRTRQEDLLARPAPELWRRLQCATPLDTLGEAALRDLAKRAVLRQPPRGQLLWARDETADAVVVVLAGRVDICRNTARGARILLRTLGPTELVGLSTVAGARHSADVVAGPELAIAVLPGIALRQAVAANPELGLRMVAHLADLLARLTDEVEALRFEGLDRRLVAYLAKKARGQRELRLTHEELGQHLGATRANVSRALRRLQKRGAVRCHRGRIELVALEGLS